MYYEIVYITIVLQGIISQTGAASLYCLGASRDQYDEVQLTDASTLLSSSFYHDDLDNYFYAHGTNGSYYGNASKACLDSMMALGNRNVFFFDWSKEASIGSSFGDAQIMATYALVTVPNAYSVSIQLGQAMLSMSNHNFFLNRTHMVAHSIGAHLFGNTGRYIKANGNGKIVDRITGLDSAGPIFATLPALDKNCATFVDVVHSDPGNYGLNESLATLDIWLNMACYSGSSKDQRVQPGCLTGTYPLFSAIGLCSHNRSWMLDVEARLYNSLQASGPASNYNAWTARNSTTVIYLGPNIDRSARGNFFLVTNSQSLFGKGPDGLYA